MGDTTLGATPIPSGKARLTFGNFAIGLAGTGSVDVYNGATKIVDPGSLDKGEYIPSDQPANVNFADQTITFYEAGAAQTAANVLAKADIPNQLSAGSNLILALTGKKGDTQYPLTVFFGSAGMVTPSLAVLFAVFGAIFAMYF